MLHLLHLCQIKINDSRNQESKSGQKPIKTAIIYIMLKRIWIDCCAVQPEIVASYLWSLVQHSYSCNIVLLLTFFYLESS